MSKERVSVAVTDFLAVLFHPKNLGAAFVPATRGQEGTEGHQLVSSRRLPGYRPEVPIEFVDNSHPRFELVLRGRIDGLLETEDGLVAEEVKTTYLPLSELAADHYPVHQAQLRLYLYFLMAREPERRISGRLTYLNLDDLSERSFPVTLTPAEAVEFFQSLAGSYLEKLADLLDWRRVRDVSLRKLSFPHRQLRAGQEQLIAAVEQAIASEQDLFAEAATGIGKTVAVLFPALKALAAGDGIERIFFLTAKTLGKEILKKTVLRLKEDGLRLRTVFIEAKDRVCLNPGSRCHPDACPYAADYYEKADPVLASLPAVELITPELVREWALNHRACPFDLALDLAKRCDLIVGDYNYVFDPGVYLRRFFLGAKKRDCLFLIDEAHNLVARGREMYSAALRQPDLIKLEETLRPRHPQLAAGLAAVIDFFDTWQRTIWKEGRPGLRLSQLPDLFEPALEKLAALIERFLRRQSADPALERIEEFYYQLTGLLRIIPGLSRDYALYVKDDTDGVTLRIYCLNPGPQLKNRLEYSRTAVFFSATLSPADYFRELLGGRPGALQLRLPSPFPQENRLYLHVPGISTRYTARAASAPAVAQCAADLVAAKPGNYLMFFPSYAYLQTTLPLIRERLAGRASVFIQHQGMSDRQRRDFLKRLTAPGTESHLGLAVLGGIFGEGIDLPGEELIGVIIVGPGLPLVNEEQELIRMYFDERDERGMLYAYVIPGLIRVVQSAGRVFRTPEDRGVVMLLDDRFATEQYQELLPPDWFAPGRPFSDPDYRAAIRKFWED